MAPPPLTSSPSGRAPWNGHPLFNLDNLYRAYRQCRRRKRNTKKALAFERHLEDNLVALRDELVAGSYAPEPFDAFLVEKPKRREIFAAGFRDRVVHHLLVNRLEPRWERRFIHDSWACRQGKGTHRAVDRLRSFLRRTTRNGTRPAYYLQLDVRGFFVGIHRQILCRQLEALEPDPAVRWLLRVILFHQPTEDSPVADGIDFLGYIVRPDYLLVRRRVVGALRRRLEQAERRLSRLGLAQHGAVSGARRKEAGAALRQAAAVSRSSISFKHRVCMAASSRWYSC